MLMRMTGRAAQGDGPINWCRGAPLACDSCFLNLKCITPFVRDIQVAGLIANRPIGELTTHEIAAAFPRCGWVERSHTDTPRR
jgi:hypothetical protein